jgi:hypothetical protein
MKGITKEKAKIKNLISIIDEPTKEDLLFEIVSFLEKENRLDEEFTKFEVTLKTRSRLSSNIEDDLKMLIESGYVHHRGWTKYRVINHPWQS